MFLQWFEQWTQRYYRSEGARSDWGPLVLGPSCCRVQRKTLRRCPQPLGQFRMDGEMEWRFEGVDTGVAAIFAGAGASFRKRRPVSHGMWVSPVVFLYLHLCSAQMWIGWTVSLKSTERSCSTRLGQCHLNGSKCRVHPCLPYGPMAKYPVWPSY